MSKMKNNKKQELKKAMAEAVVSYTYYYGLHL